MYRPCHRNIAIPTSAAGMAHCNVLYCCFCLSENFSTNAVHASKSAVIVQCSKLITALYNNGNDTVISMYGYIISIFTSKVLL